jgi:hypothetical protein
VESKSIHPLSPFFEIVLVPYHRVIAGDGTIGGFGCGFPQNRSY